MDIVLIAILGVGVYLFGGLRVLREYERAVYFFLGRSWGAKGPGLIYLPPLFAKMQKVSLRVVALDIPPQDVITRDNISIKVNAVLYMSVKDPVKAVIGVENYLYATSQLAQTTLRSVLGETELDELLMSREKINAILKNIIDRRTEDWGIEVSAVEVKDVDLPPEMKRAMARQAEAERERRAKIINAGRAHHRRRARGDPAAVPADRHRDRFREQFDHDLPAPDRTVQRIPREGGEARGRSQPRPPRKGRRRDPARLPRQGEGQGLACRAS